MANRRSSAVLEGEPSTAAPGVPDRGGMAVPFEPAERLVLPVQVPGTLTSVDDILAGTLAFLSRIGARQAVVAGYGGAAHLPLRLPLAEGSFGTYRSLVGRHYGREVGERERDRSGGGWPIVVEVTDVPQPAPDAGAVPVPVLAVQIDRCGLGCRWIVDTAAWPRASAEILRRSCETFLAGLADDHDVATIALVDEAERRALAATGLPTGDCQEWQSVPELVAGQARQRPGATAVVAGGGSTTYAELDHRVRCLATFLSHLGARPGELVGVHLDRSVDLVAALLATMRAGAAYVPLDPRHPAGSLADVLDDARPRIVLTHSHLAGELPAVDGHVIAVDRAWPLIEATAAATAGAPAEPDQVLADGLAYVAFEGARMGHGCPLRQSRREGQATRCLLEAELWGWCPATGCPRVGCTNRPIRSASHTSEVAGRPEGVCVTHRGLTNLLGAMAGEPGFTDCDTLLALTTVSSASAAVELYLPLVTGGRVLMVSADEVAGGAALARLLDHGDPRPTVVQATPATWRMLVDAGWKGSPDLRVVCGGEALSPDLAGDLLDRAGEVWNVYGLTEATSRSTAARVEAAHAVTLGRPLPGTTLHVLDAGMGLVPRGVPGELYIGGTGLATGYLGRPDLTADRFRPDPFGPPGSRLCRTGDLVRCDPEGTLAFLGHLDHQVPIPLPADLEQERCMPFASVSGLDTGFSGAHGGDAEAAAPGRAGGPLVSGVAGEAWGADQPRFESSRRRPPTTR